MNTLRHVCVTLLTFVSMGCCAAAPPTRTSLSAATEAQTLAQVPSELSDVFFLSVFDGLWAVPASFAAEVVSEAKDNPPGVVTLKSPHALLRRNAMKHETPIPPLRTILVGPIESLDKTFDMEAAKRSWTKVRTAKVGNLNVSTFHSPEGATGSLSIWNILIENGQQFMLIIDVDETLAQAMLDAYVRMQGDRGH